MKKTRRAFAVVSCSVACAAGCLVAAEVDVYTGKPSDGRVVEVPAAKAFTASVWAEVAEAGGPGNACPRLFQLPCGYLHAYQSLSNPEAVDLVLGFSVPKSARAKKGVVSWEVEAAVPLRRWAHVALVARAGGDAGLPELYVNGARVGARMRPKPMPATFPSGRATVGNTAPGGNRPFFGRLAGFSFVPRAMAAEEIAAAARRAPDGHPPKGMSRVTRDDLPIVDLAHDGSRQTVVASGEKGPYQGHPTTAVAPDGSLFCVWTVAHGGPCGPMARSTDGGRTWTRCDEIMPSVYSTYSNCPVLQRIDRKDGGVNLAVFSNCRGKCGIVLSEDGGRNWKAAPVADLSSGMPPTGFMMLKGGLAALFGQVRKRGLSGGRPTSDQEVWMSVSADGGRTWGAMRVVASAPEKNLCEPCCLRSPDGEELCLLMRENRHGGNSMMCFSRDEGQTWTAPEETCWGLSGDRHEAAYLPDGRLVVAFRDRAIGSSTYGHYVAWVGTYADLRAGTSGKGGDLRVWLADSQGEAVWDTGYSGVEVLSDGTVVCTTYVRYRATDEGNSVVSTRFGLDDLRLARPLSGRQPTFRAAEPVWHAGHEETMNEQLLFRGTFPWDGGERPVLRLAASNPYRVRLNGAFAWYGPARGPKGLYRCDEVVLSPRRGENLVEVECAGYNCATFYFQKQPSFLQAEVERGGRAVLRTAAGPGAAGTFAAHRTARVRKVSRYSHARAFGEAYVLPGPGGGPVPLARMPEKALLPRLVGAPDFRLADDFVPAAAGRCGYDAACETRRIGFVEGAGRPGADGYPKAALAFDLWDAQQRFRPAWGAAPAKAAHYALPAGCAILFEAPANRTGFPALSVVCHEPGELHALFDEQPVEGVFRPWRSKVANDIAWRFERAGAYEVEAFEPYVLKALAVVARSGRFEVLAPRLRLYRNADSRRASFRSSDPGLDALFAAAEETFAQNAVDGFLDCPGRERACWNCDAFFTSRAGALLTGGLAQETLFLDNFARPDRFGDIDRGMIPMCYPADFANGNYIPSWAMFFALQLEEYARLRGGDPGLVAALRPRVLALVDFLAARRNADGLLEDLPRWVFVDWSRANDFVRGVNYPNNMVWAAMLDAVGRLYGRPDLTAEAERVRETVRRQSYDGEWFRDQALRQPDGTLKPTGESSEACQYYSFFFGTATRELYPELHRRLAESFGPGRLAEGLYPRIWASAPFVGNLMRLDWLGREGLVGRQVAEMKGYFGPMAARTGTLWENADSADNGSCCHGFASHVAVFVLRDVLGIRRIDRRERLLALSPPQDVALDFCAASLPVGDEDLSVGWTRTAKGAEPDLRLPVGWRVVSP